MNSESGRDWTLARRQPMAGLAVIIGSALVRIVRLLWPILLIMLFRRDEERSHTLELIASVVPLVILIGSILLYLNFSFFIQHEHLLIRKGIFIRKEISIPFSRIHAVHIEQNFIQRLVNVVRVKIETAGSDKAEAVFDALRIDEAEDLKGILLQSSGKQAQEASDAELPIIHKLTFAELLKIGISANHLQAFTIILAFAISLVQNLEEVFGDRVVRYVQQSYYSFAYSLQLVAGLVIALLSVSILVSMVRVILLYSNFQLSNTPSGLKVRSGLINTRENLIPPSRIQFVAYSATFLGRKTGLHFFRFHAAEPDERRRARRQRIPVTNAAAYLPRLLGFYQDEISAQAHSSHRMHWSYATRKLVVQGLPLTLIFMSVFYINFGSPSLFLLLILPYIFFSSLAYASRYRVLIHPDAVQVVSGVWGRKVQILQWHKIQEVELSQSFFQRRSGIANIVLKTAGGNITVPYIQVQLCWKMLNYSSYRIIDSGKKWM